MKDDDYVQKWETQLLNNEHDLAELNIVVIRYFKAHTAKAIDALPVSTQPNDSDPEAIKAAAKHEMATELSFLETRIYPPYR